MDTVKTADLRPGMLVREADQPYRSTVFVHDVREATFPLPGHEWAVWLLSARTRDDGSSYEPFVVNAGDDQDWMVL